MSNDIKLSYEQYFSAKNEISVGSKIPRIGEYKSTKESLASKVAKRSGSVVDEYESQVNSKLRELEEQESDEAHFIQSKPNNINYSKSYSNRFISIDVDELNLSEDSFPMHRYKEPMVYEDRHPSRRSRDRNSNRSFDSSCSKNYKPLMQPLEVKRTIETKPRNKINLQDLRKTPNIPNIPIKTVKKSALMSKPSNQQIEPKSRFLKETAAHMNRCEKTKEQLEQNRIKAQNEPKPFVTGKVTENIFTDFNPKEKTEEEEIFGSDEKPRYQIISKMKPVKITDYTKEMAGDEMIHKVEDKYVPKQDRPKPYRKTTASTSSRKPNAY